MASYNLDDYEPVQARIPKFLEKYTEPAIITTLMSDVNNIETVIFKAELYSGRMLVSTGWAFEREGDGYVNKTSHLENCETSAIGRALANIGLHGDKRPSREEMQKVEKFTEQPKAQGEGPKTGTCKGIPAYKELKEGGAGDKSWKCFIYVVGGVRLGTFDDIVANALDIAEGEGMQVTVEWEENNSGSKKIKKILNKMKLKE